MKFLIAICVLFSSLTLWATEALDQTVSFKLKQASGNEILKELSKQTNVDFVIDGRVRLTKKSSLEVRETPLKTVLDGLATQHDIVWTKASDDTISISKKL